MDLSRVTSVDDTAALYRDRSGYRQFIDSLAHDKIDSFLGTIREDGTYKDRIYKSAQSVGRHVSADYSGRFLLELIQNAYDAHDADDPGEIRVVHAPDEGDFGVLYVANRGQPFGPKNVESLCDIGLSAKPPGQSIGNKGLGFRSVQEVTDRPLIFSRASPSIGEDHFDGFTFSFADETDLAPLIPDERLRRIAVADLPPFRVPVWVDSQSEVVRKLAGAGFSSVVALPLNSQLASETVRKEIEEIRGTEAPFLLFLPALSRLSFETVTNSGGWQVEHALTRSSRLLIAETNRTCAEVDLSAEGTYLLVTGAVAECEVKAAIEQAIAAKQIHESWSDWSGDGQVGLAVRLDDEIDRPRLYTYLPLGEEARAPLHAHLHASFFPTSNRKSVDLHVSLNSLLLQHAAALAARALVWMREQSLAGNLPWAGDRIERCAVDLLAWTQPSSAPSDIWLPSFVATELERLHDDGDLDQLPVLPAASLGEASSTKCVSWANPEILRWWNPVGSTFTFELVSSVAADANFRLLPASLGEDRSARLTSWLESVGADSDLEPSSAELATVAERVADRLSHFRKPNWSAFYQDLDSLIGYRTSALHSKRILICADKVLRPAMPAQVAEADQTSSRTTRARRRRGAEAILAPPAKGSQGGNEEFSPPSELGDSFAFLSPKLDWYGALSETRRKFEEARLILPFDTETILNHVASIAQSDERRSTRAAALKWAFQVWRRAKLSGRPVRLRRPLRLYVPNRNGEFIPAVDASYSDGWPPQTLGPELGKFLEATWTYSADLKEARDRLIAPPDHRVFNRRHLGDWVEFLDQLRLRRGLHPLAKKVELVRGYNLSSFDFCEGFGLAGSARLAWEADVRAQLAPQRPLSGSGFYMFSREIAVWPGQDVHDSLPDDLRETYASLSTYWLGNDAKEVWAVDVHHTHFHQAERQTWPTPLASFFKATRWIPGDQPTPDGQVRGFYKGSQVWLSTDRRGDFGFLRRPSVTFQRALARAPEQATPALIKRAGVRVLGTLETLDLQLQFLAEQFADGAVDRYYTRSFANFYGSTWRELAAKWDANDRTPSAPNLLICRSADGLRCVDLSDASAVAFVRDEQPDVRLNLLLAAGRPVLDVGPDGASEVANLCSVLFGERIRRVSAAKYRLILDGSLPEDLPEAPKLVEAAPWLSVMVALAMEALKGADARRLPADRSEVISKLDRIRFRLVASLRFELEDGGDPGEQPAEGLVLGSTTEQPTIILRSNSAVTDWGALIRMMPFLGEALLQTALVPQLSNLARVLEQYGEEPGGPVPPDRLLAQLGAEIYLQQDEVSAAAETLGGRLERYLPWLDAIVFYFSGEDGLDAFVQAQSTAVQDALALRELLGGSLPEDGPSPEIVLANCRDAVTLEELRNALGLEFDRFNAALLHVGLEPEVHPEQQQALLTGFIADHELDIFTRLRESVSTKLSQFEPAPEYMSAIAELQSLRPPAEWLLAFPVPSSEVLTDFLDSWLSDHGALALSAEVASTRDVLEVRAANTRTLHKFASNAEPIVRAIQRKRGIQIPKVWTATSVGSELHTVFLASGALDYRALSEGDLFLWLRAMGLWPSGVAESLDLAAHSLSTADLEEQRERDAEERRERDREARLVPFKDRMIDPHDVDLLALADEVRESMPKRVLRQSLGALTPLRPVDPEASRTRSKAKKSANPPRRTAVNPDKADLIGMLGELAVYAWLRNRYPQQDIDKAWVSQNCEKVIGGKGSDAEGFDFQLTYRNQPWKIEVKASAEDSCDFMMGESQVREARKSLRDGSRFCIAYVSNVSDPAKTRIDILPNPLSEEGGRLLTLKGQGIRYSFTRL